MLTVPVMQDMRLTKLANVLVNYSVEVKPGQLVRINGGSIASPLLVEIYRAVVKAGGNPMVRMMPDELGEILLKEGSDEQLRYVNPVAKFEGEKIDCSIGIWGGEETPGRCRMWTRQKWDWLQPLENR